MSSSERAVTGYRPRIVCAANRFVLKDGDNPPQTFIVAGARHHDSVMNPVIKALCQEDRDRLEGMQQGFIDQRGNFYSRREAWEIAERNDQIARRCGGDGPDGFGLFSENLY